MDVRVGDVLTLKKKHPCGSSDWHVLRIGADFKLRCGGCGHEIMSPRSHIEKNTKNLRRPESAGDGPGPQGAPRPTGQSGR